MKALLLVLLLIGCAKSSSTASAPTPPSAPEPKASNFVEVNDDGSRLHNHGVRDEAGVIWTEAVTSNITPSDVNAACTRLDLIAPSLADLNRLAVNLGRDSAQGFSPAAHGFPGPVAGTEWSWGITKEMFLIGSDSLKDLGSVVGIDGKTGRQIFQSGIDFTNTTGTGLQTFITICRTP